MKRMHGALIACAIISVSMSFGMQKVTSAVRTAYAGVKEKLSPSAQIEKLKNVMNCVWNNKCSPNEIRAIKYALATVAALCIGQKLIPDITQPFREKTVASVMADHNIVANSPIVQFLLDTRNYLVGSDDKVL